MQSPGVGSPSWDTFTELRGWKWQELISFTVRVHFNWWHQCIAANWKHFVCQFNHEYIWFSPIKRLRWLHSPQVTSYSSGCQRNLYECFKNVKRLCIFKCKKESYWEDEACSGIWCPLFALKMFAAGPDHPGSQWTKAVTLGLWILKISSPCILSTSPHTNSILRQKTVLLQKLGW